MSLSVDHNKERVREYFDALEQHTEGEVADLEEYVTDDVVNHNPVSSDDVEIGEAHGIAAFRRHVNSLTTAFPDLRFNVQDMIGEDDRVTVRFVLRGTHEGTLMGIEPTNREIVLSVIAIYRFDDGKIAERWGEASR